MAAGAVNRLFTGKIPGSKTTRTDGMLESIPKPVSVQFFIRALTVFLISALRTDICTMVHIPAPETADRIVRFFCQII